MWPFDIIMNLLIDKGHLIQEKWFKFLPDIVAHTNMEAHGRIATNNSLCYKRIAKWLMHKYLGTVSNALFQEIFTYDYIINIQIIFPRKMKQEGLFFHLQFLRLCISDLIFDVAGKHRQTCSLLEPKNCCAHLFYNLT